MGLFESFISLGAGWLGSREVQASKKEQIDLFLELLDLGITKVDTADSYASFEAESMLGKVLRSRNGIDITTKVGGYTSSLIRPLNQIVVGSRAYQKWNIVRNKGYLDFNPNIQPKHLARRLESSLSRLNVAYVDSYLLHGIPNLESMNSYAQSMVDLREKGLAVRVGMSIERATSADLSWCDELLVPFHLFDQYKESARYVSVHAVFRGQSQSYEAKFHHMLNAHNFKSQVIGTRKKARILEIKNTLDRI